MRPSDGQISLWPVAVIGFVLVLAAISIDSNMVLNNTAPQDFLALQTSSKRSNPSIAGAYWEVAVRVIQWKYSRTVQLPEQPPAAFELAPDPVRQTADQRAVRVLYWAKLREEWARPDNWHRTYELDFSWTSRTAHFLSHDVLEFVKHS